MSFKCPKCKQELSSSWCPDCHIKIGKKKEQEIFDTGICEKCGKRGRLVAQRYLPGERNDKVLCYWCYHEYDRRKGFYVSESWSKLSRDELQKQIASQEAFLVPLFYGEKPNMQIEQTLHDRKLGINPVMPPEWQ
ncbi:MAG: hypothetical protein WC917_00585 [Bacilli bacterium]|jgi:hypothetical protein